MLQSRRRRLVLLCVQLVTSVLFLGPFLWGGRTRGFPLDDAWIHQVVARTFAETGTLGYLPGAYGAGATSYLWAALLAVGQKVHADPVVFTSLLGIAGAIVTGQALLTLVPGGDDDREGLFAVALACAGGDLTWFALSGMEASFVAGAALAAIAVATSDVLVRDPKRAALVAGALSGVAALTRPDFVPLGPVIAAVVFLRRKRDVRLAAGVLVPWAVACALYFGSNALLAGTPMPATMRGRRWLWIDSVLGKTSTASLAVDFFFAWALRLRQFTLGVESNLVFFVAAGAAVGGVVSAVRRRATGLLVAAGFTLVHAALFVVVLPVPGHGGRYQPLVPVLFVLFAVLGTFEIARAIAARLPAVRRYAPVPVAALWLVCLGNAFWEWHLAHRDAVEHVRRTEVAAGLAVAELPADAVVASFDVGGIGYFSRRPLLDLGALTTPKVMTALDRDDVVDLLRSERVTHLVLPAGEDADFPDLSNFGFRLRVVDHPEIELTEIEDFTSDHDTWLRGVWYVQNATYRQRLWRVGFRACPDAPPSLSAEARAAAGVGDVGADDRTRARLDRAFVTAAERGLCVRVAEAPGPAAPVEGCWDVELRPSTETPPPAAPTPVRAKLLRGPTDDAGLARAAAELALWTGPYAEVADRVGAAGASLHAITRAVRSTRPCFWTPLPAIEKALPVGYRPPPAPRDVLGFGVVASAIVGWLSSRGRA